jgi:uncharacterized protein YbjT (DUF2867 family)/tryptophan-rich sensory protein
VTQPGLALVTGATGYIGGLLVPALLERGWRVRVLSRSAERVANLPWSGDVEVVEGDASSEDDVRRAMDAVDVAYFLLHSMDGTGDFVTRDRALARTFADAATDAQVDRVVYLGGLHPDGVPLSPHLASRVEVGEILLAGQVPAAVLQAGVVLGDGSVSFDMLRHLTERLPAVIAPRWLSSRIQPIAAEDVVHYLAEAATLPPDVNRTFDLGGPDVLTYADMMRRYARVTGLGHRYIATVPVLTPSLASHWVGLVTPVRAGVAKPLVGSLVHDAVCAEDDLAALVPAPPGGRTGFDEAVTRATRSVDPTRWCRSLLRAGAIVGAAAVVGSLVTNPDSRWYRRLDLPRWQPPPWAFPVVWTALYAEVTIASAAAMAELPKDESTSYATALAANMTLNAGWSALFFRGHQPWLAALDSAALTASGLDLARRARPTGAGKAVGLGAYAAWSAFATALTVAIALRNRTHPRHR